ncbi:MAG: response regulator transcription factor [Eubacteriales bacterium]|nr:response regulator transcription factor [Eubacteriales bacterium]
MNRILIVEDDKNLNNGIKLALGKEYYCMQAFTLHSARDILKEQNFDLLLLDVNFPDGDGVEFLTEFRKTNNTPVILLTANKMEMDIVTGLESGANDYITKPFSLMVLRARVGVQLRGERLSDEKVRCGDFYFDFEKMEFMNGSHIIELSKTEQKLLRCLLRNKGKNVCRSQLIDEVWQGDTEFVDEHALTVAVNRLRTKLGDNQSDPQYIKTIYGIGYSWVKL